MNFFKNSLVIFFMCLFLIAQAQDLSFSQFNLAPVQLNPALSGSTLAKARIITHYRKHTGYNSSLNAALSVDGRKTLSNKSFLGWGVSGLKQISAAAFYDTNTSGHISLSYGRRLGKDTSRVHFLIAGTQVGISKLSGFYTINATTPFLLGNSSENDLDLTSLDPKEDIMPYDLNLGLIWMCAMSTYSSFYLGLAAHHINKPKVSLQRIGHQDSINQSVIRTTLHGGGEIVIRKNWTLAPSFMIRNYFGSTALTVGTYFRKYRKANPSTNFIQAGLFVQGIGDGASSLVFATSLKTKKTLVGFSISNPSGIGLSRSYPSGNIYEITASYSIGQIDNTVQLTSMY